MEVINYIIIGLAIVGPAITWLLMDAKSKANLTFVDDKAKELKIETKETEEFLTGRISTTELKVARVEQGNEELRRLIERLNIEKASKEVVDGFRSEMQSIKLDMDKRFDKLEIIILNKIK